MSKIPSLNKLIRCVESFRSATEGAVPLQQFAVFLYIAREGGDVGMRDIERLLGLSQSASIRSLYAISTSEHKLKGKTGYGLIDIVTDPEDNRLRRCRMTVKGRILASQMQDSLQPEGLQ